MARRPRIHIPGAFYHVILRGNGGGEIFFTENDREIFYQLLGEGVERFGYRVHCFCLMSNHVHLVLQVGNISLSKAIQNLSFRYAYWINRQQNRVGHLFQGRYKAILVDTESYLLGLVRYIHLNPVRAKIVKSLEHYKWTSHHNYISNNRLPWLTTDWILGFFANHRLDAIRHYQQFMLAEVDELFQTKFIFGNQKGLDVLSEDNFLEKLGKTSVSPSNGSISLEQVVQVVCDYYLIDSLELKKNSRIHFYSKIRALVGLLVKEHGLCTLTAVSIYFNRDVTGLIRTMRQLEGDKTIQEAVMILGEKIKSTSQA